VVVAVAVAVGQYEGGVDWTHDRSFAKISNMIDAHVVAI
jgi:hypothetical protein